LAGLQADRQRDRQTDRCLTRTRFGSAYLRHMLTGSYMSHVHSVTHTRALCPQNNYTAVILPF